MSGQSIGGLIGAVAGSFIPVIGTSIGSAIGGVLGGLISPEKLPDAVGTRLTDLMVSYSIYGNMIPILFGTMRFSGNVIFSTKKLEQKIEKKIGKGGPSQKSITYSYSQTFAMALCEGVILGITKILANGKVIYNNDDSASIGTIVESQKIAKFIRIYKGTQTQLPDPAIQLLAGEDKTSAYRGTAYIVFENFSLDEFGGSMPNLTFEVVKDGELLAREENYTTFSPEFFDFDNRQIVFSDTKIQTGYATYSDANTFNTRVDVYTVLPENKFALDYTIKLPLKYAAQMPKYVKSDGSIIVMQPGTTDYKYYSTVSKDGKVDNVDFYLQTGEINKNLKITPISYCKKFNKHFLIGFDYEQNKYNINSIDLASLDNKAVINVPISESTYLDSSENFVYFCEINLDTTSGSTWTIKKYTHNLVFVSNLFTATNIYGLHVVSDNEIYVQTNFNTISGIYEISSDTPILKIKTANKSSYSLNYDGKSFYNINNGIITIITTTINSKSRPLSEVVSTLCLRANMKSEEIDVSALTQEVFGYLLSRRDSLRTNLEPLRQAYFFDAVESSGKLKFVNRGGAVAVTIPAEDLAARQSGTDHGDNLLIERKQEVDLPHEINVSYMDIDAGFQIGSQYARKQNTHSVNCTSVALPLALHAEKASSTASVLLQDAWQSRNVYTFTLSSKYAYLEPTDIVEVYKNNDKHTVRIIEIEEQSGVYKIHGVSESSSKYFQKVVGIPMIPLNSELLTVGPTKLQFLDIPLLRDQDDKIGVYYSLSGYLDGWTGSTLAKSTDSTSFAFFGDSISKEVIVGNTTNILGNHFNSGFDEKNVLTVKLNNGQLSSTTESNILSGDVVNCALIGNEIIQFKRAVLIGANTYRLSGFLRGKRGTEYLMSTHKINDRFILLEPTTLNIMPLDSTSYDIPATYKAVTDGETMSTASNISFTNTGVAQECYSPVHLGGGKDGNNSYLLKWIRRSRISNHWANKVDVPLGEAVEAYEIDIMNGSTVVRTYQSSTNNFIYTSAMQVLDFGTIQNNITFKVAQMSTLRGRGFESIGTI